jgi:preprotein translocase subunit YajC
VPLTHGLILGIGGTILTLVGFGIAYYIATVQQKKQQEEEETQRKHKNLFG